MPVDIHDVEEIVRRQNEWRAECINLIASENTPSPAVRAMQQSDFMGRYAEGHPNTATETNRYYQGTRYIDEIEEMATRELRELLGARQVDVRPISGNAANTAVVLGYLRGGDSVIVNSTDAGGHISHAPIGVMGRRIQVRGQALKAEGEKGIALHYWPLTEDRYHIDADAAATLIEQVKPRLVVLGKSLFLFPEPVREIAAVCQSQSIPVLYDGAHVLGLIAGGQFQQPLAEGATWLTASVHKTFPGPQRGIVAANLDSPDAEKKYWQPVDRGVFPGSSSNHHLHTLPALVVATREMRAYGKDYAAATVANAQALGRALDELGVSVAAKDFGFTRSHQIAVDVANFGGGVDAAKRLESMNIIVNYNLLPGDTDPKAPSGLRIGVQEMTRFGMTAATMGEVAQLISDALKGSDVREAVIRLRKQYQTMQFV
jgi:glycine hydroxymethyltransferase